MSAAKLLVAHLAVLLLCSRAFSDSEQPNIVFLPEDDLGYGNRSGPLYWNNRPGWCTLRDEQWTALLQRGEFKLSEVVEDPSESEDVSLENPEVSDRYLRAVRKWERALPAKK